MNTTSKIRRALRQLSFLSDACVVGGAVRDALIGRESDDIDLATSDRPQEVKRKAEERGWKTVDTGIEHGTVTLLARDVEYEVTTFRRDVSTDGRNATVEFADSVEEDLGRRDFTINAMAAALAGNHVRIIDPFGGQDDIEAEVVRTVGNPKTCFREDLLRIVRAIRFSCRYGFEIEAETLRAMEEVTRGQDITETLSAERIVMEIEKAFKDDRPGEFIRRMESFGILSDALNANIRRLESDFPKVARAEDRMLLFLYDLMHLPVANLDPEEVQSRLKLSNERIEKARDVGQALFLLSDPTPEQTRRKVLAAYRGELEAIRRIGPQVGIPAPRFREPEEVPLDPIVTGQDLIDRGFEQGPKIGDVIERAHKIQLEDSITDTEELIERAS